MESAVLFPHVHGNPLVLSRKKKYGRVLNSLLVFRGLTNFRIVIQVQRSQGFKII